MSRVILTASASNPIFRNQHGKEQALRRTISKICAKVSIKAELSETEFLLIYDFVMRNYSLLTLSEFEYAFELNLLNVSETRAEHFNCFDCAYIGKVIAHYYPNKQDAIMALKKALPKELPKHESTDEDFYNRLIKFIEKNEFPAYWNWAAVYNHMKETGMITESLEEKTKFRIGVVEKLQAGMANRKLTARYAVERAKIDDELNEENIRLLCQKEYVKNKLKK